MKLIKMFIPAVVCLLSLWVFFSVRTNAFAYEAINVTIPVDYFTVYGDNTHTYEVKIEPKNEEAPKPVSDSLNISEDGTGTFDISITEPGTYIYNISLIPFILSFGISQTTAPVSVSRSFQ